jgi:hypothetical protein
MADGMAERPQRLAGEGGIGSPLLLWSTTLLDVYANPNSVHALDASARRIKR